MTVHEHPGVYSRYDATSVVSALRGGKTIGLAAKATSAAEGKVKALTSCAEGIVTFGEGENMANLLRVLYENGAAAVKAVAVVGGDYAAAFAALRAEEDIGVLLCDSTDLSVQQALRESAEEASAARCERICVAAAEEDETVAELIERAAGINSERVVLAAPGGLATAAAVAAVIAAGTDPSLPLNGAVVKGVSIKSENYSDEEIDLLVRGGVTALEVMAGEVSVVRGITTRTTTAGAADATWRELTTILIVDDVIPALRNSLRARFARSKNTTQTRSAIRSQVIVELENKKNAEYIDSYGDVSVTALESDPTVCVVEFGFAVAHGLNRIYLSAHITV